MSKSLEGLTAAEQQQESASLARWRELMDRLVTKDDLTIEEAKELKTLHQQLKIAIPLADYEKLVSERFAGKGAKKALASARKKLADAQDREADHLTQLAPIQARHKAEIDEHTAKACERSDDSKAALVAVKSAEDDVKRIEDLDKTLWQFVAGKDPVVEAEELAEQQRIEARRYYVAYETTDRAKCAHAKYPVVLVEDVVINRQANLPKDGERMPLEGQSDDESRHLDHVIRTVNDGPTYRFLANSEGEAWEETLSPRSRSLIEYADKLTGTRFDPSNLRWMRHPGQAQEQLDALVAKLEKSWRQYRGHDDEPTVNVTNFGRIPTRA